MNDLYDSMEELLDDLAERDPLVLDIVQAAIAVGRDTVISDTNDLDECVSSWLLARKIVDLMNEHCQCPSCCAAVDGSSLDHYSDYYYSDEEDYEEEEPEAEIEPEEEEEPEPDSLSEELGLDVGSAQPIQIAQAIVTKAGGSLEKQDALLLECRRHGKNFAQLSSLVEGL